MIPNDKGKQKLLVIGNGMGSVRFLEKLSEQAGHPFEVAVLSEEPCPGYNRIQLSKLLAGSAGLKDIQLQDQGWYQQQGIRLLSGSDYRVATLDLDNKAVTTEGGGSFDYDRLVLATGSLPNQIPVPRC